MGHLKSIPSSDFCDGVALGVQSGSALSSPGKGAQGRGKVPANALLQGASADSGCDTQGPGPPGLAMLPECRRQWLVPLLSGGSAVLGLRIQVHHEQGQGGSAVSQGGIVKQEPQSGVSSAGMNCFASYLEYPRKTGGLIHFNTR